MAKAVYNSSFIQTYYHRTDSDPICAASVSAYTNAFKAGNDVKTANLIAAKAFYQVKY